MTQVESSTPGAGTPAAALPPEVAAMLRPMNRWAVVSVVLGLLGGSLLGIVSGVVALRQLRTRNQLGRGQAIAGIVLSAVWLVVQVVAVVTAVVSPGTFDDAHYPGTAVRSLKAGTCLDVIPGETHLDLTGRQYGERGNPVPCDHPHHVEIAYRTTFTDGPFPGDTAARKAALALCGKGYADYADDWALPGLTARIVVAPTARSWPQQDRTVMCVYEMSEAATRSVRLDPAKLTAAQRAYLQAARPYNLAVPREHISLPDRAYSAALAQAERQSADALQGAGLPGQAHDLATALRARADAWQAAADAAGDDDLAAKYTAAKDADDEQLRPLAAALRTALGLPATHPISDPGI